MCLFFFVCVCVCVCVCFTTLYMWTQNAQSVVAWRERSGVCDREAIHSHHQRGWVLRRITNGLTFSDRQRTFVALSRLVRCCCWATFVAVRCVVAVAVVVSCECFLVPLPVADAVFAFFFLCKTANKQVWCVDFLVLGFRPFPLLCILYLCLHGHRSSVLLSLCVPSSSSSLHE